MKYVIVYTESTEDRWQVHDIYGERDYRRVLNEMSDLRLNNASRVYEMHPIDGRVLAALLSLSIAA